MPTVHAYRQAGLLERYYITRQNLELDACTIIAAQFQANSSTPLSEEILFPALSRLLRTYASLSVRVEGENTANPTFVRIETVNLKSIVSFLDAPALEEDGSLESLIQSTFTHPIKNMKDTPLWRVTVTSNNVVLFAWNHTIADGQSGLAFHRALLEALNAPAIPPTDQHGGQSPVLESVININVPDGLSLTPPIEDLTDLSVPFKRVATELFGLFIPKSWYQSSIWTGNGVKNATCANTKINIRCISLNPQDVSSLLSTSKKLDGTLTSTLHTLCVIVLSGVILNSAGGKHDYDRLNTSVSVSLRPLANVPATAMGNYISSFNTTERISQSSLSSLTPTMWSTSASYAKQLHGAIPKTRELIGLLKYLFGNYEGFFKGMIGKKRQTSFEISNLGLFKVSDASGGNQGWSIGRTYFAQDNGIIGSAIKLSVVGDPAGWLTMTVTWGEGAVEDSIAESFVQGLRDALGEILKPVA